MQTYSSTGGGRGKYVNVEGDYPDAKTVVCWSGAVKDNVAQQVRPPPTRMRIITKNVFSLQAEERLEELMTELRDTDWDIVMITETWREAKEEDFLFADGHRFLGAGGTVGERGSQSLYTAAGARAFAVARQSVRDWWQLKSTS